MLREKQRNELKAKFEATIRHGRINPPDLVKHVALALASGESPKLRPAKEIVQSGRLRLIEERYTDDRKLRFSDVFASCNGYEVEKAQFDAYEAGRQRLVKPLRRLADKLNLRALNADADAEQIVEEFETAVDESGLFEYCKANRPAYLDGPAAESDED